MPNSQLMVYLTVLVCPILISLVLWSSLMPFEVAPIRNGAGSASLLICKSENDDVFLPISLAYFGLLIVIGAVLSFKTRKLPDSFRESWWIALTTYNHCFVAAICVTVGYLLSFEPIASIFVTCTGLLFCSSVQWALIFAPKVHFAPFC
jgi:hypothetical protein